MNIKDSGRRDEFETGAKRDGQKGKGRMDLLPWRAIMELSKVYEAGCEKYGDRNWEKGIPLSRYCDSGPRHFGKWMDGETDEEHLKMACWNFMSLLDTTLRIKQGKLSESLNDLPCCPEFMERVDTVHFSYPKYDEIKQEEITDPVGKCKEDEKTEALKAWVRDMSEVAWGAEVAKMILLEQGTEAERTKADPVKEEPNGMEWLPEDPEESNKEWLIRQLSLYGLKAVEEDSDGS